ncbi:cyclic lactone autoinducer peptide AgrD [Enterococcus sp. N249-2]|jgi:cyclic lactone autoinducer peptide
MNFIKAGLTKFVISCFRFIGEYSVLTCCVSYWDEIEVPDELIIK